MDEARPVILIAQAEEAAALAPILIEEGYRVEPCRDAQALLDRLQPLSPDLVVLEDGRQVATLLRWARACAMPGIHRFCCCWRTTRTTRQSSALIAWARATC